MRPAVRTLSRTWRRFCLARDAGPAIEFAFCGTALIGFLIVLLNLGLLGLKLGTLAHAVQMTGRWAVIQASSSYAAAAGTTIIEPCLGSVVTAFNGYDSPSSLVLAQPVNNNSSNGTTTTNQLSLTASWSNAGAGTAPGVYLTLTGTYTWSPLGFGDLPNIQVPLTITTAASVIGSSLTGAAVDTRTCS